MWRELLAAFFLAGSCVVIHAVGMISQLRWIVRTFQQNVPLSVARGLLSVLRLMGVLFTLHILEVAFWGEFYRLLHCFPDRETAYYFSLTSYTTVGFGDVVISHPWRLMGGLEAINGVLMFGWSTASLVAFVFRLRETRVKLSMVSF